MQVYKFQVVIIAKKIKVDDDPEEDLGQRVKAYFVSSIPVLSAFHWSPPPHPVYSHSCRHTNISEFF